MSNWKTISIRTAVIVRFITLAAAIAHQSQGYEFSLSPLIGIQILRARLKSGVQREGRSSYEMELEERYIRLHRRGLRSTWGAVRTRIARL